MLRSLRLAGRIFPALLAASCDRPTAPLPQMVPAWSVAFVRAPENFWSGVPAADASAVAIVQMTPYPYTRSVLLFDATTGARLWETVLAADWADGPFENVALTTDYVVIGSGGRVAVLARANGTLLWQAYHPTLKPVSWVTVAGSTVVSSTSWTITARDLATGALRWEYAYQPDTVDGAIFATTVSGDTVYAAADHLNGVLEYSVAMAVRLIDGGELWRFEVPAPEQGGLRSVTVGGNLLLAGVFVGARGVQAINRFTLTRPWHTRTDPCCVGVVSTPLVFGSTVYYASGDETVRAVDLATGTEQWVARVQGSFIDQPALCRDRIFASNGALFKFDRTSGRTLGVALNTETEVPSSGLVSNGDLVFISTHDRVNAYRCD